jgi:methylthioribose-1-phosphate isomerase
MFDLAVETHETGSDPALAVVNTTVRLMEEDDELTRKCGMYASYMIDDGDGILTHCYPGGALLYMLDYARQQGKHARVYCSETRPYLQGARLTAASVHKLGIPVTVVTDNMGAFLMAQGKIHKFITACDRITMDGHIANKVGTYQYAICANYHRIPFIVLGYDGPQTKTSRAQDVEIEERDPEEVLYCRGVRTGAPGVQGYYPAFDITPPTLIGAIATDRGIFSPLEIGRAYADRFSG